MTDYQALWDAKRRESLPEPEVLDLVSPAEIAVRLHVSINTVNKWGQRKLLPAPLVVLSRIPVWRWETIEEWAASTGRLSR